MRSSFRILFFCCFLYGPGCVFSQILDKSFKPQIARTPSISAVALQNDGKILVAGNLASVGSTPVDGLVRLNSDGTLDTSFDPPKIVDSQGIIVTIAVDGEGRILIGGGLADNKKAVRLNADGSFDESFNLALNTSAVLRFKVLEDNRILTLAYGSRPISILHEDGSIDETFDAGSGPGGLGIYRNELAVQPDGKIIFVGTFSTFNDISINGAVRLNPDGSIDDSFDIGAGPEGDLPFINSVALQPDGRIILGGGFSSFNGTSCSHVVRLNNDGSLDQSFVMPGPAANIFSSWVTVLAVEDGILLGGTRPGAIAGYELIKLQSGGELATNFESISTNISTYAELNEPFVMANENTIFFAGNFSAVNGDQRNGLAAFDPSGELLNEFKPKLYAPAIVRAISAQNDGKILVGGLIDFVGGNTVRNFARLNSDGTLDNGFTTNLGTGPQGIVTTIDIDENGRILVGGSFSVLNEVATGQFVRLRSDGTADDSFIANIGQKYVGLGIEDVHVLTSGKILVGGHFNLVNGEPVDNLVCLDADGAVDDTFNSGLLGEDLVPYSIGIQSNGNLIIGGERYPAGGGLLLLTDPFGTVLNDFAALDLSNQAFHTIEVRRDDSFLGAGSFSTIFYDNLPTPLFQFHADGTLIDNNSVGIYNGRVYAIDSLSESDVLMTGTFRKVNATAANSFAKISLGGSSDPSYLLEFDGPIHATCRANDNRNLFFVGGEFSGIDGADFHSLCKVNLNVPETPKDLIQTTDDAVGKIHLSWSDQSDNENGFQILRGSAENFAIIDSVELNSTTFIDSTAAQLSNYEYKVRAYESVEVSDYSNIVAVSTVNWVPPVMPGNLQYEIDDDFNTVNISWTDASDNESGFEFERSLNNGAFEPIEVLDKNTSSFIDVFSFDIKHHYRIRSFNKFGKSGYAELELPVILNAGERNTRPLAVYPNPVSELVVIENAEATAAQVTIVNATGHSLYNKVHIGDVELSMRAFPPGLYFIKLVTLQNTRVAKIVKE